MRGVRIWLALCAGVLALCAPAARAAEPGQLASCARMQARGPAYWLAIDERGDATDARVEQYQSGAAALAAGFDYSCVPKGTQIVTVFALDGEVIFSARAALRPSGQPGAYTYTLARDDGEPIPDGDWSVSFFAGKSLLAEARAAVGGAQSGDAPGDVEVRGVVLDAKTRQPIRGALVAVLVEGASADGFLRKPSLSRIAASAYTDARGAFALPERLPRGQERAWVITARGYRPISEQAIVIGEGEPDPLQLTITLSR